MPLPVEKFEEARKRLLREVKAGDLPPQVAHRIIDNVYLSTKTPEEKAVILDNRKKSEALAKVRQARVSAFKIGGKTLNQIHLKQRDSNPYIKELREASVNADWDSLFKWISYRDWGSVKSPQSWGTPIPLGKFRFVWGPDGKPRYIPFTRPELETYATSTRIQSSPMFYKCTPEQFEGIVNDLVKLQEKALREYPNTDWRHVAEIYPTSIICRKPKKSLWVKIRTPILIAAGIVAAVYLGPVVVDKLGAVAGGQSGAAAGAASGAGDAAAKASFFSKVKSGANSVLGYVNKARTVQAIAQGELPPPPVGISGNSFREWAFLVAKEELKEQAINKAAELGQEYIAKKMTEKEEKKLRDEIAAMQRELEALIPPEVKKAPLVPDQNLPPAVKQIQMVEEQRKQDLEKLLLPALIVGSALLLGA